MRLKRLEMQGFKSFADKTVLEFVDGSTAVVGPNGSGKSNISDAIRWVIGEMSAKNLRGSNMQDVIFAGTQTRRPVNFAEVSLVLDNSDRMLDIDFDEVVVTRRLFRSGESVYQINRSACRLKDIHELFMDTGLGRDGYSIIGQGNVSQILSTKAEDRRSLFEEAAGISKYKYRKEEAQRKLKGVEENLVRINDITAELESQRAPLKRQSEKARKYLTFYEEYKALDVNMSLITIDKNTAAVSDTDKLSSDVKSELSQLRENEEQTERKISALYEESKAKDKEIEEQNALLRDAQARSMSAKNEITINENNIKNNHAAIERIEREIEGIKARNDERRNSIAEFARQRDEKQQEKEALLKEFDEMQAMQSTLTEKRDLLSAKLEEIRGEVVEKLNEASSKKALLSGMETLRTSFLERREAVETEIKTFREGVVSAKQSIEECREKIAEKTEKLEKMRSSVSLCTEKAEKLKTERDAVLKSLAAKNIEYNSKLSKKKILEGMENDYAGFSKSVKAVLKAPELKKLAIYGTVAGLVETDKKHALAIEAALGGAMQNIIVESEDEAKAAIAYLRSTGAGRATFLPISSVKGREMENVRAVSAEAGFIGIAPELVKYDKKYDGIIKNLLGRTAVFDNIDNAIAVSRKFGYKFRVVTLDGDIFNAGGSISGGSAKGQSGFLSRAAEIKSLGAELNGIAASIRGEEEKKKSLDGDIAAAENQLSSYVPLTREYEDEILRLENSKKHFEESLKSGSGTEENYAKELEQIEAQLSQSSDDTADLLSAIRALENESKALQEKADSIGEELEKASDERENAVQAVMNKTMTLAAIEKDIKVIDEAEESARNDIKASVEEISAKEDDKERICTENDALYADINTKKALTEELSGSEEEIRKKIEEINAEKASIVDTLQGIQNSNKDLTDRLLNLQQELTRLENRKEKLETDNENIINRLWEDYELTYNEALAAKTETEDEKAASRRLAELKGKIKALGSVNMDAIEEYKAVEERFKFLTDQKSDLDKSRTELCDIVASMEELMEEHFEKRFYEINESFGKVFSELFGGGKGKLILSEPDSVLESGIEIEVQLPGKSLQNINLYSGGEKTFIAIALLFAMLRVNPAPFCILDEIDAALDDVNVSRFATYLKNYTEQTQFIIITHKRGTMEAANILYGVTMQEKGVSKLLSLHIDDIDDIEEELVG